MPQPTLLRLLGLCITGLLYPLFCVPGSAQSPSSASLPAAAPPAVTLHTGTHIVLTDVTVTDRNGNPVHGLPASAFHIFDNKKPQHLASFTEQTGAAAAFVPTPALAAGIYSNDFLLHLPPVLNVLVIDTTNLRLTDQMYLNEQLTKFIKSLAPGETLAVYDRSGTSSVLLQNFTSDHRLLLAALARALPRFMPYGREYLSDLDLLQQIAVDLSQIPGRKNVLWFSGGTTLFLLGADASVQTLEYDAAMHQIYDELEAGRIAIYPVDARGLTIASDPTQWAQDGLLNDVATATGGKAFYNTNGLGQAAGKVLATGGNFYTLTYSPSDFKLDNKWHNVKVTLDGDAHYALSYRRGYFDDGSHLQTPRSAKPRARLLADGTTLQQPDVLSSPIIFQASVVPAGDPSPDSETGFVPLTPNAPPKKSLKAFTIRYTVPAANFTTQPVEGGSAAYVGVAVVAFDEDGSRSTSHMDQFKLTLAPRAAGQPPDILRVKQQIDLGKHDTHLYLVVWDMANGRLGSLQIPFDTSKALSKATSRAAQSNSVPAHPAP